MTFRGAALVALAVSGCGAGNAGMYAPSYGGTPQCHVADVPPPPHRPAYTPPSAPSPVALAPWEQHVRAGQMIATMAAAGARIGRMLEQARAQKDVVKTLCMNEKLAQVDVALRSAIERKAALGEAATRGDVETSAHELGVLGALEQRVSQLSAEANQCIGEELAFQAETVVTASVVTRDVSVSSKREQRSAPQHGSAGAAYAQSPAPAPPPAAAPPRAPPPMPAPGPKPAPATLPAPSPTAAPASVLAPDAPHDASLMVYSAEVGLAVRHVGSGLDAIEAIARDAGGFLSQRADRQITVMVPRDRFVDALARIERLGDVRHHAVTSLDVTDEYVDLEVRLTNARAIRERLRKLRELATTVADQLEVERELGRITGEIDRTEGKLKLLSEKIAYSTITVALEPIAEPSVCATTVLPFPWLTSIGLSSLLAVHD